jgi:hypothetical protein
MKKRNKKYNPERHNKDKLAAFHAINLSMPVSDNAKSQLLIGIHSALKAFTNGVAEKVHFDTLASTVDLTMMMSKSLFEMAYWDEINEARDAMIRCRERFARTGKLGLDGEGITAIKFAIELHEEQLSNVTGAEVMKFMETRTKHIRSGNFYKGAEVKQMEAAA